MSSPNPPIELSGTTNFLMNMDALIRAVYSKVAGGDDPSAKDYAKIKQAIGLMMVAWQNEGIQLWKQQESIIPLIAGQIPYTLDYTVIDVFNFFFRTERSDTVMESFTREDYTNQSVKTTAGQPNRFYIDWQLTAPIVRFYPVYQNTTGFVVGSDGNSYVCTKGHTSDALITQPVTGSTWSQYWEKITSVAATAPWAAGVVYDSGVVHCTKVLMAQDLSQPTQNPDAPVRWHEAIVWNAAARVAPDFALQAWERQDLKQWAVVTLASAQSGNRESSDLRISPKMRR